MWRIPRSADWPDDADTMAPKTPPEEEPPIEISPEADAAMAKLVGLFSDPSLASKARLRCSTEGPDEFDLMFESILDDQCGHDPNSEYKQWVRRLYRLGLISRIPSEWKCGKDKTASK